MTQHLTLCLLAFSIAASSCHTQQMVQTVSDARKLENHQDQFVGKPFKVLLAQIGPTIKMAYGNPDEKSGEQAPIIILYFVDKDGLSGRTRMKEKPTRIGVYVKPKKGRNYPPLVAMAPWTEEQETAYGDMTVLKIWVLGEM